MKSLLRLVPNSQIGLVVKVEAKAAVSYLLDYLVA